jgi:hypothetical protein
MPNSPTAALFEAAVAPALQCSRAAKTAKALGLTYLRNSNSALTR